jgi:hypothetical protein
MLPCLQNDLSHNGGSFRHEPNELQFLRVHDFNPNEVYGLLFIETLTRNASARGSHPTR